ncbi:phosphatidylinositol N-acetylglucosaminyltransferase subunit C [Infundibulicybe gibba]|nr:phosphatidylinositol N-acetylglucosaminyltransferase subunit C [Infundibulicybe gibba]
MSPVEKWEPILWKRQPYPDNHIPKGSFLSSLKKNPNFTPYTYWPLVLLACVITQHLATIFLFLAIFVHLKEHILDPHTLVWVSIGSFVFGYTAWELLDRNWAKSNRRDHYLKALKSSILIFLALMSISPVLRTLTAATSSDSIWALSAILFTINALLADYSSLPSDGQPQERLTSVLSINAAVSSSVVLASRLSTDFEVFALILFSIHAFALFPLLRHRLQESSVFLRTSTTLILFAASIVTTARISVHATCIYAAVLVFVTFIAPAILVWAQQYKNEIRGPWDVAIPKVN